MSLERLCIMHENNLSWKQLNSKIILDTILKDAKIQEKQMVKIRKNTILKGKITVVAKCSIKRVKRWNCKCYSISYLRFIDRFLFFDEAWLIIRIRRCLTGWLHLFLCVFLFIYFFDKRLLCCIDLGHSSSKSWFWVQRPQR